jgi:hypothetical protein
VIRALLALLAAVVPAGDERAFVEFEAPVAEVHAGEAVRVVLRVGVEERFLAEGLVPSSLRKMDVPVRVEAPWLDAHPGAARLAAPGAAAEEGAPTLAVNDEVLPFAKGVPVDRDGRRFAVFEHALLLVPLEPGALEIPAPVLRWSEATSMTVDAFGQKVAADRRDGEAKGASLRLGVRGLPAEGRPEGFQGAVGRYAIRAVLGAGGAEAGGSLRLDVVLEGEGNLPLVEDPLPISIPGFHLLGKLDDKGATRRTLTFDLRPEAGTEAVPAIPFPYFDPGPPPEWKVARTDPIPLPAGARESGAPVPAPGPAGTGVRGGAGPWILAAILVLLAATAVFVIKRVRVG